jgi:hypothetical protein
VTITLTMNPASRMRMTIPTRIINTPAT